MKLPNMEKPIEPQPEDCCNSGCSPCIFEIYEKQLALYEKYLDNGESLDFSKQTRSNGISQLKYTKFVVKKKISICNSHKLIIFKRDVLDGNTIWWNPGDHFLVKYISNEGSCTRAYTPIIMKSEQRNSYDFGIIVKQYDGGKVSSYLCNLDVGNVTLWRGPYGQYEITPNKFNKIIMIAQGTGIAPLISIINSILANEDDMTKITLFYCTESIETILFRDEFYEFKSYWNFSYYIYLSTNCSIEKTRYQEPIKHCKLSFQDILCNLEPHLANEQFLICGSQIFNEHYVKLLQEFSKENIITF